MTTSKPKKRVAKEPTQRGAEARRAILDAALTAFRTKGFDATTMRDVAASAGVALGGAYYYFPSKEALVLAYYEQTQDDHERRCREIFATEDDLRARLAAVFHTKLDSLQRDRKLLGALFRSVATPDDPVSVFGAATAGIRARSIATFEESLARTSLTEPLRNLVATGLWAAHLAILLFFLHDDSKKQSRTRAVVDALVAMMADGIDAAPELLPVLMPRVAPLLSALGVLG
jgi:AcrR family transcriptional regulator